MPYGTHIKSYSIAGIIIVLGLLFWYFSEGLLKGFSFYASTNIYALIALSLYFVSVALGLLLIEHIGTFLAAITLSLLPVVFFYGATTVQMGIMILAVGIIARSFTSAEDERENRIEYSAVQILRRGLPIFVTAISLIIASTYYLTITGGAYQLTGEKLIPRNLFDVSIHVLQPTILSRIFPEFNDQMQVDEYVLGVVTRQSGIRPELLTPRERTELVAQARQGFFKDFHISLSGSELLGDVFYRATVKKGNDLIAAYERFIPGAFAVGVFLVLKTIGLPFSWLVIFLAWIILKILMALHVVEERLLDTQRKDVRWK